jgi:hypothetical protein
MTIKIIFETKKENYSLLNIVRTRINLGLEILQPYIGTYFHPHKLEIWLYSSYKELGGELMGEKKEINFKNKIETYNVIDELIDKIPKKTNINNFLARANSIINISGRWKFEDKEFEGYYSINNSYLWKNAYGDIEMNAYPTEEYEDFIDMFWKKDGIRKEMVDNLFEKFIKEYHNNLEKYKLERKILEIEWACFGYGVPSISEIDKYRAAYFKNKKSLVSYIMKSFAESNYQKAI